MSMPGIERIKKERIRQIAVEGYTAEHDKGHAEDLIRAANCYTQYALMQATVPENVLDRMPLPWEVEWEGRPLWPWAPEDWKPDTIERNIEKAGALLAAFIDARKDSNG